LREETSDWRGGGWTAEGSLSEENGERRGNARVQWAGIDSLAPARLALTGLPIGKSIHTVPTVRIATALRALENSQILFSGHHGIY
jgi:hypothetical protein